MKKLIKIIILFSVVMVPLVKGEESPVGYPSVDVALKDLKSKPGAKVRNDAGWTIIEQQDEKNMILWSFVPESHPAYPAVAKRTISEKEGGVYLAMAVLCQAGKTDCDKLVEQFKVLNKKISQTLQAKEQEYDILIMR